MTSLKWILVGASAAVLAACASVEGAASKMTAAGAESVSVAPNFIEILPSEQPVDAVLVEVESGTLVGKKEAGAHVFRGVPYAAAPVGDLRWKAPQPVEPWIGQRAAFSFESRCTQPLAANQKVPNQGGVNGTVSEDCLYLSVYAPEKATKAPVVFWMHGGGAFLGAGSLGSYVATENAKKGVITVPINYRLGPMGYFAHPAITEEDGPTGAYALMDAVAGLEWVRDNIEAFGGDPNNVTIAGQSAGGVMVVDLLSIPSAQGLFHKAVVQSGAFVSPARKLEDAEAKAVEGLAELGVPADASAAQLREVSAQTLAHNAKLRRGLGQVLDGEFWSTSPKDSFANGTAADVPVIVGSNGGEGGFDRARDFAKLTGADGASAFLYHFDYVPAFRAAEWPKGPIHSAELMFTHDTLATSGWAMGKTTAADDAFAKRMSACWVAFYKMDPASKEIDCGTGFKWPAYTEGNDAVAVFDRTIRMGQSKSFPDGPPRD